MPKFSLVTIGRNDDYDGNFTERLAYALSQNIYQLPNEEFIFVEWNPIMDKPLVCEELKNIFADRIQYYVAHPKFHPDYCTIYPFIEYPAKNIGIRRATGDFIISMNSDVILTPELIDKLKRPLLPRIVYRADRIDLKFEYQRVKFPLDPRYVIESCKGLYNACGDFLCLDRDSWNKTRSYCEEFPQQRLHKDSQFVWLLTGLHNLKVDYIGSVTHWRHPSSWSNGYCRTDVGNIQWDFKKAGFVRNKPTWGLSFAQEINRDGIIWLE
jgi:hypothetical protein